MKNQCRNFDCAISRSQTTLFDLPEIKLPTCEKIIERVKETCFYIPQIKSDYFKLQNRRYIGSKYKLLGWIFSIINKECKGNSFADIFAGTGIVSAVAAKHFKKMIIE